MSERDALEAARDALDAAYARSGHPDDLAAKHLINIALAQHDQATPGVEGWKTVPVEPEGVRSSGGFLLSQHGCSAKKTANDQGANDLDAMNAAFRAMVAAAPALPTTIRGGREEIARIVIAQPHPDKLGQWLFALRLADALLALPAPIRGGREEIAEETLERVARALDAEDCGQRGEPSLWDMYDRGEFEGTPAHWAVYRAERLAVAKVALDEFLSSDAQSVRPDGGEA